MKTVFSIAVCFVVSTTAWAQSEPTEAPLVDAPAPLVQSAPPPPPQTLPPPTRPPPPPPPPPAKRAISMEASEPYARRYGNTSYVNWDILANVLIGINTAPAGSQNDGFGIGVRSNIDVGGFAIAIQYDYLTSQMKNLPNPQNRLGASVGGNLVYNRYGRLRLLAGADFRFGEYKSAPTTSAPNGSPVSSPLISPIVTLSGRLGNGIFGLDAAAIFGTYPLWQFEARAGLAIRLLFVQVHIGWRFMVMDNQYLRSDIGAAFREGTMINGPYVAAGFGW